MKPFKVLKEHDSHFDVDDGSGKPFRVAKGRLAHSTVERIRKFASGGEVPVPDPAPGFPEETQTADPFATLGVPKPPETVAPAVDGMRTAVIPEELASMRVPGTRTVGAVPLQEQTPPAAAIPGAPAVKPPAEAGPPPDIAAGQKDEIAGVKAKAAAVQAEGAAQANILGDLEQKRARLADEAQKYLADRQAGADKLFNDIQTSKVEPTRYWNNLSTGQRVSASIGLFLGGIGSGLTGQPNPALHILDKAIDRDIESQKIDLGKKETLYGRYLEQTKDGLAAKQLAKADAYDVTAAQLQKVAATYSGQKAAADAQSAVGQLRQQGAVLRQQATERALQIQQGQLGLQAQRYQAQALQELMKGVSGGGGFDRRVLELPAFKDYRERAVDLPDGSVAFAADKEEAGKAREAFGAVGTLKAKLQRFSALAKNGDPATLDRGAAQALRADILAEMGHLHGLNRLSDKDLELFEQQVPDLTNFLKPTAQQKLKALGQSIDDKVWSVQQNMLSRPRTQRPNAG